jgi:hypothetical protein
MAVKLNCFLNLLKPNIVYIIFKILVRTAKKTNLHYKIEWLILFRDIIAVYSENHKKPINTLYEQNVEIILMIKADGTYSYHWALRG